MTKDARMSLQLPLLSVYGALSAEPSPANRMMAAFVREFRDGFDINLGVGYVNERTIPTALFVQAMEAVAGDPGRYRQAFNYGGPEGSPNLIRSLRGFLLRHSGGLDERTLHSRRLIIGSCGAMSLLEGLAEICRPGLVVTSDPGYYIYLDALERRGFRLLAVPEDDGGIRTDLLERRLAALGTAAENVLFFYFMTVSNPAGAVLSNARRLRLLEIATAFSHHVRRRVPVVFNLAYEQLVHDPAAERPGSVLSHYKLGIAYEIGTLSKILAPALRIGYLLGPDGPLMSAMVQRTSDAGFSAPLFVQEMASWLLDHHIDAQIRAVKEGYREKAVAVRAGIERSLGPLLERVTVGSAGFYFYLTFRDVAMHPEVAADGELREAARRQLRVSYGFEETERILEGLEWMGRAARGG